ncbi:hypothetical protein GRX03_03425 [Halovenus sp. WSH3]|uniref:Uncharacterized protein n=1 Tax=Halovenus carboxidivorans TaxID=2692199 RepID=A0A6B0T6Z4_9EURY|nr:hypothetical protein [Halovenus carboxidivorans]MXR50660.1 hypothetical protein [Halovenus carboxidivorans]
MVEATDDEGGAGSDGADYGVTVESQSDYEPQTDAFDDLLASEPADPENIDHEQRGQQRIAPPWRKIDTLPRPLVECGCGDCPERYDPLADTDTVTDAFSDLMDRSTMAADECPNPRPMTVERAATAYYVYEVATHDRDDRTSKVEKTAKQHGRYLDGERELLTEHYDDPSTALLSFRPRPIGDAPDPEHRDSGDNYGPTVESQSVQHSDGKRRWRYPTTVDYQLHQPIRKVYEKLYQQLRDFSWSYVWVVSGTDSAATPHLHWLIYVDDPDDELTAGYFEPAVDAFVEHCQFARHEDHSVGDDTDSDAVVVHTEPPKYDDVDDEQLIENLHYNDKEGFELNTRALAYLLHQRPYWVFRRIREGQQSLGDEQTQIDLQAAAVRWASVTDGIASSQDFPS